MAKIRRLGTKMRERLLIVQRRIEERFKRIGKGEYGRVLKMARRPTSEEYSKTVMITGAGILLIGLVGFIIYVIMSKGLPYLMEVLGIK